MNDLKGIKVDNNTKIASFDITNMYSNIPTTELSVILTNTLRTIFHDNTMVLEVLKLYHLIVEQNCFTHEDKTYRQNEGLAMGSPSSAIPSEIFLQFLESNHYSNILQNNKVIDYFRYVDDVLIVYYNTQTDINQVLHEFNQVNSHIQFTWEMETNRRLNFLDITIHINESNWDFSIFRKPTFIDTIIPLNSCHPQEQNRRRHTLLHK
jgi:hypothetical protein